MSIVRSVLEYTSPVWSPSTENNISNGPKRKKLLKEKSYKIDCSGLSALCKRHMHEQ